MSHQTHNSFIYPLTFIATLETFASGAIANMIIHGQVVGIMSAAIASMNCSTAQLFSANFRQTRAIKNSSPPVPPKLGSHNSVMNIFLKTDVPGEQFYKRNPARPEPARGGRFCPLSYLRLSSKISRSTSGLAEPLLAFIPCPTRNWSADSLPLL